MPRCQDVVERMSEYTDGTLPWTARLGIWLHLEMCWMCRRYRDQFRLTVDLLRLLAGGPVDPLASRPRAAEVDVRRILERAR